MNLQGLLNGVAASFFSSGMDTVVGWAEWIIRVCGELYHGEICNIHEMFAVAIALI